MKNQKRTLVWLWRKMKSKLNQKYKKEPILWIKLWQVFADSGPVLDDPIAGRKKCVIGLCAGLL